MEGPDRRGLTGNAAALATTMAALAVAVLLAVFAQAPSAEPARGSDEAFSTGPYRRRVTSSGAQRWTGPRDPFRFERLPVGAVGVEVSLQNHSTPVSVVADGVWLGVVPAGMTAARFELPPRGADREVVVELLTGPGPTGAQVTHVRLVPTRSAWPGLPGLLLVLAPAMAATLTALWARASPPGALAAGLVVLAALAALLGPAGVLHSPWAVTVSAVLVLGSIACGGLARLVDVRHRGAGPWAFGAGFCALLVQGVAATTPLMPVSDALFHAHKLQQVAAGDLFPVSLTQHATPFRFPYGVAFYAVLAPLLRVGLDPTALVRWGAAVSGLLASAALFGVLLPRGAVQAGLATTTLQFLPVAFDVHSYGNLSNVFGQSLTVLFFAWWAGSARGGWATGALLAALASLSHFSSFVVLGTLAVALAFVRWRAGTLDRARVLALLVGLGAAGAYYLSFLPLIVELLPRLKEGGGSGRVRRGLLAEAWDEARWLRIRWGLPAIVLGVLGRPRTARGSLDRDLSAFWGAGAVLAVLALTTPLEVRYVYALTLPLAAGVADALTAPLPTRRRALVALLGAAQLAVGASAIFEAVVTRYR